MHRNRPGYGVLTVGVLLLGLASGQVSDDLPFVRAYVGDALWEMMVFLAVALIVNRWPTKPIAFMTGLFSFGIEVSQSYHAPWIDTMRSTRFGGLVLGYGFRWTALICYGIAVGVLLDQYIILPER